MIRFTYKYLKPVALFLAIAVLFQCCKVYDKQPVSIDEAINNDIKRVKIITNDDREYVFDSIYYKNDKLYGLLVIKGKDQEIIISSDSIKEIRLYSQKKSGIAAFVVTFVVLGGLIGVMVYSVNHITWDF